MPELPDIHVLVRSLNQALPGRAIAEVSVYQPKCVNLPVADFRRSLSGRSFGQAWRRGKWALIDLDRDFTLAANLGMGGEMRLRSPQEVADPKRERVALRLEDGAQLWFHFWWFGHVHLVPLGEPGAHPQLASLGPEPMGDDFTPAALAGLLRGKRGLIKHYLLDQRFIAGIGNMYVQDILWQARLHPCRPAHTLAENDVQRLHGAIRHVLSEGIRWGGARREYDVWGNGGSYHEHYQIAYRTGQPCPACGTAVEELRVGSTNSYLCPRCQPLT